MMLHTSHSIASRSGLARVRALPIAEATARRKSHPISVVHNKAHDTGIDMNWRVQAEPSAGMPSANEPRHEAYAMRSPAARTGLPVRTTSDAVAYRLIFTTTFVVFLFASVLERAFHPLGNGGSDTGALRKSIVAQAKEAANISAVYAFMG
jgi:hypothetical protein